MKKNSMTQNTLDIVYRGNTAKNLVLPNYDPKNKEIVVPSTLPQYKNGIKVPQQFVHDAFAATALLHDTNKKLVVPGKQMENVGYAGIALLLIISSSIFGKKIHENRHPRQR